MVELINNKKISAESWTKSFLLDQVFGSTIAKFNLFVKKIKSKANVLAQVFASKSALPHSVSGPKHIIESVAVQMQDFIIIRFRLLLNM